MKKKAPSNYQLSVVRCLAAMEVITETQDCDNNLLPKLQLLKDEALWAMNNGYSSALASADGKAMKIFRTK